MHPMDFVSVSDGKTAFVACRGSEKEAVVLDDELHNYLGVSHFYRSDYTVYDTILPTIK